MEVTLESPTHSGTRPPHEASLTDCYRHTDLEWRLTRIPDEACARGAFFNMLDDRAAELGATTQQEYRRFFQTYKFSTFRWYPLKDYVTRIVTVAQIHFGGPGIHQGMFHIQASAYRSWRRTMIGRAVFALLGDMASVLRATERGYAGKSFVNYVDFSFEQDRPDHFTVRFRNEYLYVEHAMAGALTGMADVLDERVRLDIEMDGPFDGTIGITMLGKTS